MIYLLIGELSLVNKEIDKIIEKSKLDENNISKYDLEVSSIENVVEDLDTISLFNEKKIIICFNINLIDNDDILIKYLNNKNDNILIMASITSLDSRKKITKEITKNSKVIDLTKTDLTKYVKERLTDYEINNIDIMLLIDYCNNDYSKLSNELDKLMMYKLDTKKIDEQDIKKLVKKGLDKTIFDLTNAINRRDAKEVFKVYHELLNNNEDELKILNILATNFKLMYKIKELIFDKTDEEAISILSIHPYRFKLLKQEGFKYDKEILLNYIKQLSDIDIGIKSGNLDKKTSMEIFLANLVR